MSLQDRKKAALSTAGFGGSLDDQEHAQLTTVTSKSGALQDLAKDYLQGLGYSGSVMDMYKKRLADLGYVGNINDAFKAQWGIGNFYGGGTTTYYLLMEDGSYYLLEDGVSKIVLES